MHSPQERLQAYQEGRAAYHARKHPFDNPHTPAPPGDLLLARLWRAGWHAAARDTPNAR